MPFLAVLGVGTGIGKTHTATRILHALRPYGRVAPFKPVESGTDDNDGVPADAAALLAASGLPLALDAVCPWPLPRPVAPADEFERLGRTLALDELTAAARTLAASHDGVLFEGAGGVLSPITWDFHAIDVANALNAPVLLIAKDELGALSHCLTAIESLRLRTTPVVGVVLNRFPHEATIGPGVNATAFARLCDVPIFAVDDQPLPAALVALLCHHLLPEADVRRR